MMVRMVRRITGLRDGIPWPAVGGLIDLPDWEAEAVVGNGDARHAQLTGPSDLHGDAGGVAVTPAGETVVSPAGEPPKPHRRKAS